MKKEKLTSDKKRLKEILLRPYPVEVHHIPKEDGGGYHVFLPDFGHSACSAAGDTLEEAMNTLEEVKKIVIAHYLEKGIKIPDPSGDPVYSESLQQVPFRIPKSTHRRLKEVARKEGLTLNALLSGIVTEYITLYPITSQVNLIEHKLKGINQKMGDLESLWRCEGLYWQHFTCDSQWIVDEKEESRLKLVS